MGEQYDTSECAEIALDLLRAHDSPLVLPTPDGVHVGKHSTWVHGKTLGEALVKLEAALTKKRGG